MEALVAVSAAALTIYDMCKALDKAMEITDIYLVEKIGGKSGHFLRKSLASKTRAASASRNLRSAPNRNAPGKRKRQE